MHIPVAHIEAGLRSYDRSMPEEINRVLVDHISGLLFCPTETAVQNLLKEGIIKGVYNVGDVMVDALLCNKEIASRKSDILTRFGLTDKNFILATIHRPSNTDNAAHMKMIIQAFGESGQTILFPIHPRTRKYLKEYGYLGQLPKNIIAADPLGYIDMLHAMAKCQKVITDSGGVQKEAYILGKPCITVRENTEWIETLEGGWNILTGPDKNKILDAIERKYPVCTRRALFGEGDAAIKITDIIEKFMK
jgi:UDP-N-acetylglucosamine 2-epimerase (non-hydrolysing)